jgi:tetratricopeptide (TPR) repeat protein
MIKKSFLACATVAALISSPSAAFAKVDAASYRSDFDEAVRVFNASNYEKAYNAFYALYEVKPDDSKVNFYLGRAALELKKYDEAAAAFERVLIMEPTHARSRLEMARVYFEQKEFEMAESEFDEALKSDLPKQVKDQVLAYKSAIEKSRKKHFTSGFVVLGVGYDSNVNNGIGAKDYSIPLLPGLSLLGDLPKEDYYHSEIAGINHIYDMKEYKDGMFWQDNVTLYMQNYRNAITNNSRYLGVSSGPGLRTKEYEVSAALTADKLIYGGVDYMYSFGLSPKGSYKLSDSLILESSYSIKNKFYYYDNWARNSIYQELSMGVRKLFAATGSMLSSSVVFSKEMERFNDNANTPGRTDVSNSAKAFNVNLYHPLMEGLDMTAGFSIKNTAYTDTDAAFLTNEKDLTFSYNAGLLKSIAKDQIVNFNCSYSNNKSNFENKVYQKRGFNVSYIYSF